MYICISVYRYAIYVQLSAHRDQKRESDIKSPRTPVTEVVNHLTGSCGSAGCVLITTEASLQFLLKIYKLRLRA